MECGENLETLSRSNQKASTLKTCKLEARVSQKISELIIADGRRFNRGHGSIAVHCNRTLGRLVKRERSADRSPELPKEAVTFGDLKSHLAKAVCLETVEGQYASK